MTATLESDDGRWTLVFVRDLKHSVASVWEALTDPSEVDRWAPYAPSRDLGATGDAVLTMIDGDEREDVAVTVLRVEPQEILEHTWGDDRLRWELTSLDGGTRLTLRHTVAGTEVASYAAGWHICTDTLDRRLAGEDVRAVRGRAALPHGWAELRESYAKKLAV